MELHVYSNDKFHIFWDSEIITGACSESFDLHFLLSAISLTKYTPPTPLPTALCCQRLTDVNFKKNDMCVQGQR